jgi:hypothetical protein
VEMTKIEKSARSLDVIQAADNVLGKRLTWRWSMWSLRSGKPGHPCHKIKYIVN